jgi:chromosomal replication initiator protein
MGGDPEEDIPIELGVRARRAEPVCESSSHGQAVVAGRGGSSRRERGALSSREARRASREHPPRPRLRSVPVADDAAADVPDTGASAGRGTRSEPGHVDRRATPLSAAHSAHPSAPHAEIEPTAPVHTFDTFVVGPCNALAREAALAVARGQQRSLSQLFLCAPSGMGKTHLSRAAAAEAARLGAASVQYVSAETFTNQFMAALRTHKTGEFKRRYRGKRQLLVVEDVQFLERKEATQLEFFHTVAHVLDSGGRVVVTGDRMPSQMSHLGERLRAQLMGGFVAELEPPDAQVRRAILRAKAAHGGWRLPGDCLDALVDAIDGSVRDLESVLIQLVTTAALTGRPIDLELTRTAIAKKCPTLRPEKRRLTVAEVVRTVAAFFQTTPDRLASRSRKHTVLVPRQLAMYLCRRYTDATVAEIGQALGRDHPSVRNAIAKVERAILEKPKVRYQLEAVVDRIEEQLGTR